MSSFLFFSFGLLISFLLCISSSPIHYPIDAGLYQEENAPHYNSYNNEYDDIPLMLYRLQRSSAYHPRTSRNSWFRVSSYQHLKPTGGSEEKIAGDNLMRWG